MQVRLSFCCQFDICFKSVGLECVTMECNVDQSYIERLNQVTHVSRIGDR